jgi:hypothetical protein
MSVPFADGISDEPVGWNDDVPSSESLYTHYEKANQGKAT